MKKILVIDDNELISMMLREHLAQEGYEVVLAHDANEGYAAAIDFVPDLILLDVQLPDVVGFDLIRIIKHRDDLVHIPIVMITGTAHSTEEKVKGFKLGADDYVLKPFDMPELLERIAAVLRRSERKEAYDPVAVHQSVKTPITSAAAAKPVRPQGVSLFKAVEMLLVSPLEFPLSAPYPPASMAFLIAALVLGFIGLAAAAGPAVKPTIFSLVLVLSWVSLASVLVMSCSVIGVHLSWKEGARLFSLAMMPLLLKLAAGVFCSFWTSLSPFYFTAGPAVFFKTPSFWLERFDVFELWSVALLWWLLSGRAASSPKRAAIVSALVWLAGAAMILAAQKVGS
jgi:DNA-binding response OmpR family regulator